MTGRVPVLRQNDVFAFLDQSINGGQNFIAMRDSQRAAGAEVILNIDDNKGMTDHKRTCFIFSFFTATIISPFH